LLKLVLVSIALVTLVASTPARSQTAPPVSKQTKRIEALVDRAAALVDSRGKAAFGEFRKQGGPWRFGDTYLFAEDINLNVLLNPAFPDREGMNAREQKDANGKPYHAEFLKTIQTRGAGWVDYAFPKPGQTRPSRKWSYVKAVTIDGAPGLIGAGFYPR
jgi:hypothetical protein